MDGVEQISLLTTCSTRLHKFITVTYYFLASRLSKLLKLLPSPFTTFACVGQGLGNKNCLISFSYIL